MALSMGKPSQNIDVPLAKQRKKYVQLADGIKFVHSIFKLLQLSANFLTNSLCSMVLFVALLLLLKVIDLKIQ